MSTGRRFIDSFRNYTPQWLANRPGLATGYRYLWVIALLCDIGMQATLEGVRAAFPGVDARTDNLPLIGASRTLVQGETETAAAFQVRCRAWLTTHILRGDEVQLAKEIQTWIGNNPTVTVITRQPSVITTVAAGSDGAALPQSTINVVSTSGLPAAGTVTVSAHPVGTTIAPGSNGATLPTGTIHVASAVDFPSSGTVMIESSPFVATTVGAASGGTTLPQATLHVASTTSFPSSGTVLVNVPGQPDQAIAYTGVTPTSFTGCTGGVGTLAVGGVAYSGGLQRVSYTGKTSTTFTGCTGGTGTLATADAVSAGGAFTTVSYTGVTGTTLTGCTGGVGTLFDGGLVECPMARYTTVTAGVAVRVPSAPWNWDAISHPERFEFWWDFWIVIYPTEFATNVAPGAGPGYAPWEGVSHDLGWGHQCTRLQVDTINGLVTTWKGGHMNLRAIVWSYDPTLFLPGTPFAAGNPDGTWGKDFNVATNQPTRNRTCRYWDRGLELT